MNCSPNRPKRRGPALCCLTAALVLSVAPAVAAPPKITRLSVRGFQIGGVTRISVQGTDLGAAPKLVLGVPIKSQSLVSHKPDGAVFDVALDSAITAGIEHLRVQTAGGVSTAELVTLDGLPQAPVSPGPATASVPPWKLPVALHGAVAGSAVQEATFAGRKGQAIVVDVLARRFGSKLRPVVHLYDSTRRQIAWSLPQPGLAGDARLNVTLPADGTYTVAVHDLTYNAAAPSYYRLAVGALDYIDAVYPPVTPAQTAAKLEGIGRGADLAIPSPGAKAVAAAVGQALPLSWPGKLTPIGLRPHVLISPLVELVEDRTLDAARQLPSVPVAVSGRLLKPGETDFYLLDLAAGEKVRIDVLADRLGSPLDAVLEVQDSKGARLAQNDDAVGPDPRLDFTAPKQPSTVRLLVSDTLRRGDSAQIYRLVVTQLDDAAAAEVDFRLTFTDDTHNIPIDGTKLLRITAQRNGYDGPIRLTVADLPNGFTATAAEIPADGDGALLEIRRTGSAADAELRTITIRGEGVGLKPAPVRIAESAAHPMARLQPWLKYAAVVAPSEAAAGPNVEWDDVAAKSSTWFVGTDDKLKIRLRRDPAATGVVRLSLLTSQAPAADQQGNQAAAQQVRGVMPTVDLKPAAPAKPESKPAGDTAAEYAVRIPVELRLAEYDAALKAELLSADGKTVVAESYSPPRRFRAQPPIALTTDAAPTAPIKLDPKTGATLTLSGSIERFQSFAGDVTVTVAGLPAGVTAPSVVLKPKGDRFKLDVKLPPNLTADKLDELKITASIPTAQRANTPTVKVEVALPTLSVDSPRPAADKPSPQKPAP